MRCCFRITRIQTMQYVSLVMCVFVTACADQATNPPTAPTQVTNAFGQAQARGAEQLPFQGSLQALETDVVAPPHLLVDGTATGTGTQLGRFAATFTATVTLATGSATGSITFTAANGDRLDAAFLGQGTPTTEPNVASIEEIATINGGTGRFASATGTFTIHRVLDQVTGVSTGSFDGVINSH
jgi:hypothetical protein